MLGGTNGGVQNCNGPMGKISLTWQASRPRAALHSGAGRVSRVDESSHGVERATSRKDSSGRSTAHGHPSSVLKISLYAS